MYICKQFANHRRMGVIARQSIRGAIANYLGVAIGFFTTFFVLTDCLSQEEIGLTRVMVDAAMLFSGLAQLGTNSSIVRFFPYFKTERGDNHGIFGWSLIIPLLGFSLFSLLFFVFRGPILGVYEQKSSLLVNYFYLLLPLTFFALYMTVFETNASVLLHITVPKFVREVGIRVFNLVCYELYGKGVISLDVFVLLFCGSYALAMVLNLLYLFTLGKISFRIDWKFMDRRMWGDVGRYTLFMTATVLAGNIPLINSLFLGAKAGLALTGVYTIAFYIANIVEIPYRSLGAISGPVIAQSIKENNWAEVNRLGRQVSLHQLLLSSLIFFFIWINLKALFMVIPHGAEYVGGMGVVFFLGIAKIVNSSFSIGCNILNYSRFYAYSLLFIAVLTVSAIGFNDWFISMWGINGAACATLFSYILYFSLLLTFVGVRLHVTLFCRTQLRVLALMLVLFGVNYLWETWVVGSLIPNSSMVWVLGEAVVRTLLFLVVSFSAVRRMHISSDVDKILSKIPLPGWKRNAR